MPYFPKEEAETIKLATVVYEMKDGEIVMQGGKPKVRSRVETGETLTIVRKDSPVGVRRAFYAQYQAAQNREKRIARLTKQMESADSADFDSLQAEIDKLSSEYGSFDSMCRYIADSIKSWDYYATKADYEAGTPIPLTTDDIRAKCDPDILSQIIEHLNAQSEQENIEGNGLPSDSVNGSARKEASESAQASTTSIS